MVPILNCSLTVREEIAIISFPLLCIHPKINQDRYLKCFPLVDSYCFLALTAPQGLPSVRSNPQFLFVVQKLLARLRRSRRQAWERWADVSSSVQKKGMQVTERGGRSGSMLKYESKGQRGSCQCSHAWTHTHTHPHSPLHGSSNCQPWLMCSLPSQIFLDSPLKENIKKYHSVWTRFSTVYIVIGWSAGN